MMHDCAITENYTIFPDLPLTFDMQKMVSGEGFVHWDPDNGSRKVKYQLGARPAATAARSISGMARKLAASSQRPPAPPHNRAGQAINAGTTDSAGQRQPGAPVGLIARPQRIPPRKERITAP